MQISGSDDEHNVAPGYVVPSHWGPGKALVSPELFLVGNRPITGEVGRLAGHIMRAP
jgi:hypothetical protein